MGTPPNPVARDLSLEFVVGQESFGDLQIDSSPDDSFYYFFHKTRKRLIKRFVLVEKTKVAYFCKVALIKKGGRFSPRLELSVRDLDGRITLAETSGLASIAPAKARVDLEDCHENFWKLVMFLQSFREIEIPGQSFSLVSQQDKEIVTALRGRDAASLVSIIKELSSIEGVSLSHRDLNHLLKRREKLTTFKRELNAGKPETWWQDFLEQNKWIFGYGLIYQIFRQEQAQPILGGTRLEGRGGQRGDYLGSTVGDVGFTVLVEIKSPDTPMIQGAYEIRSGAWSLSKDLVDALSQIEANINMWDKYGSRLPENVDRLETKNVYTVLPKGIIVIGVLAQVRQPRSKRETFERFRRFIHGVEIITFDELYHRAKFIVEQED
jgi:antiviral defense system Shedu protein SduA